MNNNKLIIFMLCFYSVIALSQDPIKAICDDALDIPYQLQFNGFIIFDDSIILNQTNSYSVKIIITKDSINGETIYSKNKAIEFEKSGFFNLKIGSIYDNNYRSFLSIINQNTDKLYFINVYLNNPSVYIGSQPILTVPYAMVGNSLNGIGEPGLIGKNGETGEQGLPGFAGASFQGSPGQKGDNGLNGFGLLEISGIPPIDEKIKFYVDDGTNTIDGKPHLRYRINTNTWIEL